MTRRMTTRDTPDLSALPHRCVAIAIDDLLIALSPASETVTAARIVELLACASRRSFASQYDDEKYEIEELGEAGAAGYLVKTDAASEPLAAVRAVHSGRRYLSPRLRQSRSASSVIPAGATPAAECVSRAASARC